MEGRKTIVLNKVHIIIYIVIGIMFLVTSFLSPFLAAKETEKQVMSHESRICKLEDSEKTSRELLLEIKFNLKNLVEKTGGTYFESQSNQ